MAIMEILVSPLVGAALQVLFASLASSEIWHLFKKRKVEVKQLTELKSLLLTIGAVVSDAEEKEITNPSVKLWVDELKDAVYEAEDVLDEVFTNKHASNPDLKNHVGDIIFRLKSLAEQKDIVCFKGLEGKIPSKVASTSLVSELKLFGRENDEKILELFLLPDTEIGNPKMANNSTFPLQIENDHSLVETVDRAPIDNANGVSLNGNRVLPSEENQRAENHKEVPVLAIVGMPGIGKTALAQRLFNFGKVTENFDVRAWVHVSKEFNVFKLTQIIYAQLTCSSFTKEKNTSFELELNIVQVNLQAAQTYDLNTLQVRIQEALRGKKFLLVLDDVWNKSFDDWDVLKRPFQEVAPESRIILTSHSSKVASTFRAAHIHHLPFLSAEDCWSLFTRHACRPGIDSEHPEIKEKILKKCHGLPLAAKALGALLYTKAELDEWDGVLNSEIWNLPSDECNILPVLRLSYYHLPPQLKPCFAYCSIFPKGYQIKKPHLVRLWMAQGLLMQHKDKRREEVGDEFFHELLSRSFFQQCGRNDDPYFIMHDLFNDLARDIAGEFCSSIRDGDANNVTEKIRHFSFLADKYDPQKFESFRGANHLRTFLPLKSLSSQEARVLSPSALKILLEASGHLRVLSLWPYKIEKLDKSIGKLKYLRYLDLSQSLIKGLPKSICSLCNLETLLLLECRQLERLPDDMKDLINLQHLNIKKTKLKKMPQGFGKLEKLNVLTDFVVGEGGASISELEKLSELGGVLSIRNLEGVDGKQATGANLKGKKYLDELVFEWTAGKNHSAAKEVLDGLMPHKNLKKLTIKNYGNQMFPKWLGDASFSKVVYLHLVGCENCPSLPSLGQLSSLKELHVNKMSCVTRVGPEFCQSTSFESLQTLKFENMLNWKDWSPFTGQQFPNLENLHLRNCPNLIGQLPKHLHSLKSLQIHECKRLQFNFQSQNRDHHYEALKSLDIWDSCDPLVSIALGCFTNLQHLCIRKCSRIKIFGTSHQSLNFLEKLKIQDQDCSLVEFSPGSRPNLVRLSVANCHNVAATLERVNECGSLKILKISCCQLMGISGWRLPANLTKLNISECPDLASMPEQMNSLSSLVTFKISDCPKLVSFPVGCLPVNLVSLSIKRCKSELTPVAGWRLYYMASLDSFEIEGDCTGTESFPEEDLLPLNLKFISISGFKDLKSLNNKGLKSLNRLNQLAIINCEKLEYMSDGELPPSLQFLSIDKCTLAERCREGNEYWNKVSHIPNRVFSHLQ